MKVASIHFITLCTVVALILPTTGADAQRGPTRNSRLYRGASNYGVMKLSAGIGSSTYFGDLCETGDCLRARPYFNLGFDYRFTGKIRARIEGAYYRLEARDAGGKNEKRNLSFRSGNIEVAATGIYEFFSYNKFFNQRPLFNPYLYAGVGFTYFTPRTELDGKWYSLPKYATEGVTYNQLAFMIPYGFGVQMALANTLDVSFEFGIRKTFTDYLDDVSTVYIDNAKLASKEPIAAQLADRTSDLGIPPTYDSDDGVHWNAGHKRGNPDRKDSYIVIAAKLEYTINPLVKNKRKNIKFRKPKFSSSSSRRKKKK